MRLTILPYAPVLFILLNRRFLSEPGTRTRFVLHPSSEHVASSRLRQEAHGGTTNTQSS